MSFNSLEWARAKTHDVDIVHAIRHDVRKYRREKGRAGHRFRFATIKNIWYVDEIHAVINHTDDPLWQYWYNHPQDGWILVHWYTTRREAQAAAELPHPEQSVTAKPFIEGIYVRAGWDMDNYTMRVTCSSDRTAVDIQSIFRKLGCFTSLGDTRLPGEIDDSKDVDISLSTPNFDESVVIVG